MPKINLIMYCEEVYSLFSGEFSQSRFGGAGLQMFYLACEFAKDPEIKVTFVFKKHDVSALNHPLIKLVNMPTFIAHGVPGISRIINDRRKAQAFGAERDNAIFFSTMALNAKFTRDFAKNIGAKSVLRVASDTDVTAPFGFDENEQKAVLQAMSEMDQIVVLSEVQKANCRRVIGVDAEVIKNGIPLSGQFTYGSRKHILWISSAQELKQPHYMIDLARAFPQEKFVVLMPYGGLARMHGFESRAKETDNLTLVTEQVSLAKTNELFSHAKLFINTSAIEGFPNTFLQAAAAGVPIISLKVNPDGVLEKEKIGIGLNDNLWAFPTAVAEFLNDPIKWNEYSRNGIAYVQEKCDISIPAKKYKELFTTMIDG